MELKPLSNTTTKQVIDATRAYTELIRVRRKLQKLGGRMFWKRAGDYVYLAQCSFFDSRKVRHVGIKSSHTEQRLKDYEVERAGLQHREAKLQERISIYERMNKAVRAGAVSNGVIDAIRMLERIGISEDCVWVGTTAQHAYWQHSGLETPKLLGDGEDVGQYLVFVKRKIDARSLNRLYRFKALKLDVVRGEQSSLLIFKPTTTALSSVHQDLSEVTALRHYSRFLHDTVQEYIDLIFDEPPQEPFFEHVLISKTGRMGMMKTVDPNLFMACSTLFGLEVTESDLFQQLLKSGHFARKAGSVRNSAEPNEH